jgi:hypothetical protein
MERKAKVNLIRLWSEADDAIGDYFRAVRDEGGSRKLLQQINDSRVDLANAFKQVQEERIGIDYRDWEKDVLDIFKREYKLDKNDVFDPKVFKNSYESGERPTEFVDRFATKYRLDRMASRVARRFIAARGTLKVGDKVMYGGSFGRGLPVEVTVTDLGLADAPKSKRTIADLREAPWALIKDNWVLINVKHDEGATSWGYGFQFEPA